MSDLRIESEPVDGAVVIKLIGEGHVGDGPKMAEAFDAVLADDPQRVVVDMSQLVFASSIAMGAIVKLRGQLKQRGGSLRMAALTENVGESFRRSRLDWAIPTFDTVEQALSAD